MKDTEHDDDDDENDVYEPLDMDKTDEPEKVEDKSTKSK